ncbi:hypothetical protein D039_3025B, partial [Vibrio parahaemolyticus EKP-028]
VFIPAQCDWRCFNTVLILDGLRVEVGNGIAFFYAA